VILVIQLVKIVLQILSFLILVDVIGSWIQYAQVRLPTWVDDLLRAVRSITHPILDPVRRLLPNMGGLDLSPIVVLLLISLLQSILPRY
jgi:YggT family protein